MEKMEKGKLYSFKIKSISIIFNKYQNFEIHYNYS